VNKQHNAGLFIVCAMVVACVWLLRGQPQSLQMVIQLATGIAGGIVGNAMRGSDPAKPPGTTSS